jgi:hypothetical protein
MTTVRRRYVVEHRHPSITAPGYWYGPAHGWGTTSGALDDYATARFPNRIAAERALRKTFGSMAEARRRGYRIIVDPSSGAP